MPRTATGSHGSPHLSVHIGQEEWDRGVRSDSGVCTIADSLRAQYPEFTRVAVDVATIRFTDAKKGLRYIYLTPEPARLMLLSFDQGWSKPPLDEIVIKKAVQVLPVTGRNSAATAAWRRARLATLEAKEVAGELTGREKAALARLRNPSPKVPRPTSTGPADVKAGKDRPVIRGGKPIPRARGNPNLLGGRDRHFGARLADPGVIFREAVERAVEERMAEQGQATDEENDNV
jgi:hypothetical protein